MAITTPQNSIRNLRKTTYSIKTWHIKEFWLCLSQVHFWLNWVLCYFVQLSTFWTLQIPKKSLSNQRFFFNFRSIIGPSFLHSMAPSWVRRNLWMTSMRLLSQGDLPEWGSPVPRWWGIFSEGIISYFLPFQLKRDKNSSIPLLYVSFP